MSTSECVSWTECSQNHQQMLNGENGIEGRRNGCLCLKRGVLFIMFPKHAPHLLKCISNQIRAKIVHARLASLDGRRERVYPLKWYQQSSSMMPARPEYKAASTVLAPSACVAFW
jgi:hypothetical protein